MENTKKKLNHYNKIYEVMKYSSNILSNETESEQAVDKVFRKLGEVFHFSTITLREITGHPQTMRYIGEYLKEDLAAKLNTVRKYTAVEWTVMQNHFDNGIFVYSKKENDGENYIDVFDSERNVTSIIQVPMYHKKRFIGVIDFIDYEQCREWAEEELELFKVTGFVLYAYLVEKKVFSVFHNSQEEKTKRDKLTGLWTYDAFLEELAEAIPEKIKEYDIAIAYSDIRNFKQINEDYGVSAGDEVIQKFANLICHGDKEVFIAATRVYSDNFIAANCIKKDMPLKELRKKIEELNRDFQATLKEQFYGADLILNTGINIIKSAEDNISQVITNADFARKEAKKNLDNRCLIFTESMLEKQKYQLQLISALPKALKNRELKVYYQPKVETGTGRVIGAEALIRWQKEDGSFIYPDEFIPVFEQKGNIVEVDFFVYREVFATIRERLDKNKPVVPVSMNVSRIHLQHNDILPYIKSLFAEYQIPAQYVEFELTESMYIESMEQTMPLIDEFHDLGIKVSMDDFGSGYSSLNLLTSIPIDVIKLDKVFMQHEEFLEKEKIILTCIIDMAKKLHITALCEGVETQEQCKYLTKIGCDIFQGYYYSRPLPMEAFYEYVEKHINVDVKEIRFTFDHTLKDTSGRFTGRMIGDGIEYADGPQKGTRALRFPGGERNKEVVWLPADVLENSSFTISLWALEEEARLWGSAFYIAFENGFASIMPRGWEMKASFRIKEDNSSNWYDAGLNIIETGQWNMLTASYDEKNQTMNLYMNGYRVGGIEDAPRMKLAKEILIGGDIYEKSFRGRVADLRIFDQALSGVEIKKMFDEVNPVRFGEEVIEKTEVRFPFAESLWDTEEKYEAKYNGDELRFGMGPREDMHSIYLPGGNMGENILRLPCELWQEGSFTIQFWMKSERLFTLSSVYYGKFKNGFHQIMPMGWDEDSVFRTKDISTGEFWDDWIDCKKCPCPVGEWVMLTITFDKKIKVSGYFINDLNAGNSGDCPVMRDARVLMIGGDEYQQSFQGYVSDFKMFNYVLTEEQIRETYYEVKDIKIGK